MALLCCSAVYAVPKALSGDKAVSDQQAAVEAKSNRDFAMELLPDIVEACRVKDWPTQSAIMKSISVRLKGQPTDHQKYRARLVYSSCTQMILDANSLNGSCFNKGPTQHELSYFERVWSEDSQACDAAIDKPDLTYDDPEPQTDDEWADYFRKKGESEEDIKAILEIRKL